MLSNEIRCRPRSSLPVVALCLVLTSGSALAQKTTRQVPVDSLIYDLKNPDPERRKDAAIMLGNNRVQRATPELVAAAGDSVPAVRREIVTALDKMLDIRALPAFVQLSGDAEKDIRDRCILGIVNLYLPQESGLSVTLNRVANFFNPWSDEWADVVVETGIRVDPTAVVALRNRLQDPEESIRVKSLRALGILRGKEAVPAIVLALRDDRSNSVRFEAVRALRKIGDPSVARDIMNYISYNDEKVRNEAVYSLGRLRFSEAVPELTRIFEKQGSLPAKDIDKGYREQLLDALAFIAAPSSKDLFLKESRNPDDIIRLHAYEGLARLADPSMVSNISRERLNEKQRRVQTAQAYALYRMGRTEYLDEVVKALASRGTNNEARQYLIELKPAELPALYALVKLDDVDIREALAEIFGLIGDSQAIPALQQLSKDRRGQVAALANQALRRINARSGAQ
jgi:HEAT repeat protein